MLPSCCRLASAPRYNVQLGGCTLYNARVNTVHEWCPLELCSSPATWLLLVSAGRLQMVCLSSVQERTLGLARAFLLTQLPLTASVEIPRRLGRPTGGWRNQWEQGRGWSVCRKEVEVQARCYHSTALCLHSPCCQSLRSHPERFLSIPGQLCLRIIERRP